MRIDMNTPLQISQKHWLRNRVVVPPMASATADSDGFVTSMTCDHYKRLSLSGAGLIMVEYTFVHRSGKSEANQLGVDSDAQITGLSRIAKVIHEHGAKAAIQLVHAGGKSSRELTGGSLLSPSGISVPVKGVTLETPDEASLENIQLLQSAFVQAARRAENSGFDIVELHAAHGYGLNQWLSPITNRRTDAYGGSLENRLRLLLEIIAKIRKDCPDLELSVRMPGQDHHAAGITPLDAIEIAKQLEASGIHVINVSSGIGGWRRPESRMGEGYLVDDAALIQAAVRIPVIGVGGIQTSGYISRSLREKKFSLAAVGRAILNDEAWGKRVGLHSNA